MPMELILNLKKVMCLPHLYSIFKKNSPKNLDRTFYVIVIAFPLQLWFHERVAILRYVTSPVLLLLLFCCCSSCCYSRQRCLILFVVLLLP